MARTNAKTSTPSEKETAKVPTAQPTKPASASNTVAQAAAPARSTVLTHEQIARRAYEIFLARGGEHGHHEQDWAQAERELRLGRQ
jgi:hypothetical protein